MLFLSQSFCLQSTMLQQSLIGTLKHLASNCAPSSTDCLYVLIRFSTDLDSCDFTDIQWFFSILSERYFRFTKPFSIKRFNKENKEYLGHDIFEEYVADNWEDILPEDMVESIVDRMDVASITNRNDYGGGNYEVVRELQLGVAKRVCDKIKSKYA